MEGYHDDDEMEEIDPLDQPGDNNMETQEFDVKSPIALDLLSSGKCKPLMNER